MGIQLEEKKKHSRMGALCSGFGLALLVLVILLCLPLTVPRLLGYELYAIVTGSMVYAKQAQPEEIEAGDVIVFYGGHDSTTIITHRAVENHREDQELLTKGDANAENDMLPIAYHNLIGRVALSIPLLGFLLPLVTEFSGKLYLAGILGAGVLFRVLGSRLKENED